jgi:hypothetical protein
MVTMGLPQHFFNIGFGLRLSIFLAFGLATLVWAFSAQILYVTFVRWWGGLWSGIFLSLEFSITTSSMF